MERATGIEPASSAWKAGVLPLNYARKIWSGRQDLNLRHPAPKAGALPNCAIARYAIKAQEIIINDAGYIACRAYEFKKVLDSLAYERHLYSMMLYND